MKHLPGRFAAPPSLAFGGRGAHPEAWQSQFLGFPADDVALVELKPRFHVLQVARRAAAN